jgi:glycosyltransferase involved in cell wall biosynthesis
VCFNAEKHLATCLRSVRAQDHPDVEHVIVDGASTDGTVEIAERERGPGSRLVSEPDRGLYDAMNKGIGLATGEYVALLNSDDRYAHERVLSTVAAAFAQDRVDAVLGDVGYFDPARPARITRRYNSGRFRPNRIAWGVMPAHPAMVLTADAYRRVGPYRTDLSIAADFELVLRAFLGEHLTYRYIPEIMVEMQEGGLATGAWRRHGW